MRAIRKLLLLTILISGCMFFSPGPSVNPALKNHSRRPFRALALYENGGHHKAFTDAALPWLKKMAADSGFTIDFLQHADSLNTDMLSRYQLFIQLDYVPYGWTDNAKQALLHYLSAGKGGWVGLHHASLLGSFDGFPVWQWYDDFMGGIHFKDYIPGFADGMVRLESRSFPVFADIPDSFKIKKEEWYTYDKIPDSPVTVLATVNENSYQPASSVRMGYHPVIWTNTGISSRNIYLFMGHSPDLLKDPVYCRLLSNSIFWAAGN